MLLVTAVVWAVSVLRSVRLRAFVYSLPLPMTLALVTTGHPVEGAQLLGVVGLNLFFLTVTVTHRRLRWPILLADLAGVAAYVALSAGVLAVPVPFEAALAGTVALWALAMLTPQLFAAIFTSVPALRDMTVHALRIYMGATGLFGIQLGCQQTFVAMGNAKTSVFLALLRKVFLLIPLIFILPCFLPNKVDAVFLAEPSSDFIAVCVTGTMFYRSFSRYLKESPQSA